MICPNDGMLRARLDNELTSTELEQLNQHLASCTQCRSEMDRLTSDAARVHKSLTTLTPRREQLPVDATSAYADFRNQLAAETPLTASWLERVLAPRWRPAWGLIAVAATVGVFVGFNPARTWAQRIFAMLR